MANNPDDVNASAPHSVKPANPAAETIEAVDDEQYPEAKDRAGQLLKGAGRSIVVTPEDNKRILRKIDLAILPVLLVVYCLQSLDKTSLAYASVFGLIEHAHLVDQEYSWLGAIVYVAQLVWQPVVAYFLVKRKEIDSTEIYRLADKCHQYPSASSVRRWYSAGALRSAVWLQQRISVD